MARFTAELEVAASDEEAFAYLADPRNRQEWDGSVRSLAPVDGAGGAVGDRYEVTVGFYGKAIEGTYEIVELEPPRRVVFAADGRFEGRDVIEVEATDGGATIRLGLEVRMKGMARLLDRGLGVAFAGIGENAVSGIRTALGNRPSA